MADQWTVLIVEADAELAARLADAFRAVGAEVLVHAVAGEAIAATVEHKVDVVLADVELPGESGLAVLQHLRTLGSLRHLPVLLLGPIDGLAGRVAAFGMGCDDYLPRGVDPDELVARARRALAVRRHVDGLLEETARLRELSTTDGLTEVANHRFFEERLGDEFRRAQRYDDALSLIVIDIDHFKLVNDLHGHQAGDTVLKGVAEAVRQAVRETDFVARYGGDEFAVLLPKTHLAGALTVAERVSQDIRRVRPTPAAAERVTASVGVSGFPSRNVHSPEQLFSTADQALYRAKHAGRNRITLYSPSLFAAQASPTGSN